MRATYQRHPQALCASRPLLHAVACSRLLQLSTVLMVLVGVAQAWREKRGRAAALLEAAAGLQEGWGNCG
jgi:hypothetical protein